MCSYNSRFHYLRDSGQLLEQKSNGRFPVVAFDGVVIEPVLSKGKSILRCRDGGSDSCGDKWSFLCSTIRYYGTRSGGAGDVGEHNTNPYSDKATKNDEERDRKTAIRFYRILLRQCSKFQRILLQQEKQRQSQQQQPEEKESGEMRNRYHQDSLSQLNNKKYLNNNTNDDNNEAMFLLQYPLNPRDAGSNRIIEQKGVHNTTNDNNHRHRMSSLTNNDDKSIDHICDNEKEEFRFLEFFCNYITDNKNTNNSNTTNYYPSEREEETTINQIINDYWKSSSSNDNVHFHKHDINITNNNNASWIRISTIQNSLQQFFKQQVKEKRTNNNDKKIYKLMALKLHRLLLEQMNMWNSTSVSISYDHNIRVVATSSYAGSSLPIQIVQGGISSSNNPSQGISNILRRPSRSDDDSKGSTSKEEPPFLLYKNNNVKHRFCYRIRIENIASSPLARATRQDSEHKESNDDIKEDNTNDMEKTQGEESQEYQHFALLPQLLGRTWYIREFQEKNNNNDSEDNGGGDSGNDNTSSGDGIKATATVARRKREFTKQVVDAPTSGAVGQLPVLQPGHVFEYMSGCELASGFGEMEGSFHFAFVPSSTKSATLGMHVDACNNPKYSSFSVPVGRFELKKG